MMKWFLIIAMVLVFFTGCLVDVDYLKENGPAYFESLGFTVLGYEGFKRGIFGGKVWFYVSPKDLPSARYSHYIIERRGEIHWYYGISHKQSQEITINKKD